MVTAGHQFFDSHLWSLNRCVLISHTNPSTCLTPVAACGTTPREEVLCELVFHLFLYFGILQRSLRVGMAAAVDGAVRRDYGHGVDCSFRVHGGNGSGIVGERQMAASARHRQSCSR